MALSAQFLTLVTMLRNELGRSSSVAVGVDDLSRLKHEINKAYETLADKHDWAHLRTTFAKTPLAAGQRYYNFPTSPATLNHDKIEGAWAWWSDLPHPITRGISINDYAGFDSTNDQRADPVQKFDIRWTGSAIQFEVWPLPSTNDQEIQFLGQRKVARLVNDADLCLLDDWLVVMSAAVPLIKDPQEKRAKQIEADARLTDAKADSNALEESVSFALTPEQRDPFKGVILRVR
jgi:hypothetical protein